jgi:hypothetical protein
VQTNFGFIVCYDIDDANIEVISIQKLINIDRRKLVTCPNWFVCVLKQKENTDILIK